VPRGGEAALRGFNGAPTWRRWF